MRIKKFNKTLFIDTFIIFLNISNSYSIIPYLLFFQYFRAINTGIIAIINVIYIIYRFKAKIHLYRYDYLFFLYVIINVLNYIFGILTGTFGIGMFPFIFSNTTFYIILYSLFYEYLRYHSFDKSIWLIFRGYFWLVGLSMASVLTLYFLITFFDFYPLVNEFGSKLDLFKGNIERNSNVHIFFPLNIGIIESSPFIRIPFFQKYGNIVGLFHEPHTFTFLVIPSIFLIYRKLTSFLGKITTIFIYLLVMLIASSAINFISMFATIGIVFLLNIKRKKNILLFVISGLFLMSFIFYNRTLLDFIITKLHSRSVDYSLALWKYAFSPHKLVGTSFFDLSYWNQPNNSFYDIGYITFILNLIFLSLFISKIIKVNILKSGSYAVGAFVLYFLFHSTKVTMYSYSLSYLMFVLFLINVYLRRDYFKQIEFNVKNDQ